MKRISIREFITKNYFVFIVALVIFLLYFSILPKDYTDANNGADGGDLLSAILTGGIPHPTGYPTYLLIGKLFQWFPVGTPYFKGALLSAFFSSLTAGLVAYIVQENNNSPGSSFAAATAGIALGISPLFWSQGVIVEVYALQSFFTVCTLIWLAKILHVHESGAEVGSLPILSIILGLGTGNHIMIALFMLPAIAAIFSLIKDKRWILSVLVNLGLIATAAILVYTTLPFKAAKSPPVNWGNPQTLQGFMWLISGKMYHGLAFGISSSEIIPRISYYADLLIRQFGISGIFIGILGFLKTVTTNDKMRWIHLWTFLSFSVFSIFYKTNDSIVYLIPVFIVFSTWIGAGVRDLWTDFFSNPVIGKILVCVFLLLLVIRIPATLRDVDPRSDKSASVYAENCLKVLPEDAVLITIGDTDTFPIWYYHYGLGQRSDIKVVVGGLIGFEWYRESIVFTYPGLILPGKEVSDIYTQLSVANPDLPICRSENDFKNGNQFKCVCRQINDGNN